MTDELSIAGSIELITIDGREIPSWNITAKEHPPIQLFADNTSPAVFTVHPDGTISFGEHLTPREGAEETMRILLELAAMHSEKLRKYLEEE